MTPGFQKEVRMNRESRKSKKLQAPAAGRPVKVDLKSERVQDRIQELPNWELADEGKELRHVRKFLNPGDAEAWANFVIQLACSHGQPVTLGLAGKKVEVTLPGHPARGFIKGGITNAVVDLAEALA
jgi:pterin-4a-carbinolamine dehydratase